MSDIDDLAERLRIEKIPLSGSILKDSFDPRTYYVFVTLTRDSDFKQHPTNVHMRNVKNTLSEEGVNVEFVLNDAKKNNLEEGLRATLLYTYGEFIRNVFLTSAVGSASVWIEPKKNIEDGEVAKIKKTINVVLHEINVTLAGVFFTNRENLATSLSCLQILRRISPATEDEVGAAILNAGFELPSSNWVVRRLDALRRGDLVVRTSEKRYVLTLRGLRKLGTDKNRESADIKRLLELARKTR